MRRFRPAFLAIGLALVLRPATARAQGPVPVDEFNPAAKSGPAPVPATGGDLVAGFNAEPNLLSDMLDNSAYTQDIVSFIFEALLTQNKETFEPEPWLAERYEKEDIEIGRAHV